MKIHLACAFVLLVPLFAFAGDLERAVEAYRQRNFDLAITCFTAFIRENPKNDHAYLCRAMTYSNEEI
jgi:hypothetical protein